MDSVVVHERNHELFQRGQFSQRGSEGETGNDGRSVTTPETGQEAVHLRDHVLCDSVDILNW